jgi:hypothetical protein
MALIGIPVFECNIRKAGKLPPVQLLECFVELVYLPELIG